MAQPRKPKAAGKRSGKQAPPEKFLEIARKGKDVWNAWRRDNPDEQADFSGVDFTSDDNKDICFAGYEFGEEVNFTHTAFGNAPEDFWHDSAKAVRNGISPNGAAIFDQAQFGDFARFDGATIGDFASFANTTFGDHISFHGATFAEGARFNDAVFGFGPGFVSAVFESGASFNGSVFGADTRFDFAAFGKFANFSRAAFGHGASFGCTAFSYAASFIGTMFGMNARFDGTSIGDYSSFSGAIFAGLASFSSVDMDEFKKAYRLESRSKSVSSAYRKKYLAVMEYANPAVFNDISFARTHFGSRASFRGRSFNSSVDFSHARFMQPPDFRDSENFDNFDWTGTRFGFGGEVRSVTTPGWATDTETATKLRRLRKIASEIHAHDAERDLFILERMAERGTAWAEWWRQSGKGLFVRVFGRLAGWWRPLVPTVLLAIYRLLSDCGRSIVLPLFWLVTANAGFFFWYRGQVTASAIDKYGSETVRDSLITFTLSNALPFVGSSRQATSDAVETLFGGAMPDAVYGITLFQGLSSVLLLFLLGLALRAHFKVR